MNLKNFFAMAAIALFAVACGNDDTTTPEQETAKAWLYSMGSGAIQETPKTQAHKVRPIITINR